MSDNTYTYTTAEIIYTDYRENKFNEGQKEITVGFKLASDETVYRNFLVEGGPEKVREFSGKDLARLVKVAANSPAGQVPVRTWVNDKGYTQIAADDGYRPGQRNDDAGF